MQACMVILQSVTISVYNQGFSTRCAPFGIVFLEFIRARTNQKFSCVKLVVIKCDLVTFSDRLRRTSY